jgi:hypothetical protein
VEAADRSRPCAVNDGDEMLGEARAEERADARRFVGMGLGIGAVGALSAAAFGAVCPVCVVAAPALLAVGVAKHVKAKRKG